MTPAKVDVLVGQFCYSSNGGYSAILPQIGDWWAKVYHEMCLDERIGNIGKVNLSDTPLTLTRNALLRKAVVGRYDLILMVDSDNEPDLYVDKGVSAKPFWQSTFDFAYRRLTQGLPSCVGAPYCGPPPHPVSGGCENVYVFKWLNWMSAEDGYGGAEIAAYDRNEAALMTGIAPAAALPTGLLLMTTNALECIKPPYFRYEWKDHWEAEKASTEDVYFTRNLAMAGRMKWGTPIVFANWDAWAGHHKPKCVGKPIVLRLEQVCETFAEAVRNNYGAADKMVYVNPEMKDEELEQFKKELRDAPDVGIVPIPNAPSPVTYVDPTDDVPIKVFTAERNGHEFSHLGWTSNSDDRDYLQMVVQMLPKGVPLLAVELGSWVGDSATAILEENPDIHLTCVDTWDGDREDSVALIAKKAIFQAISKDIIYEYFLKNTQHFRDRCKAIRNTTVEAAKQIDDGTLDFIYIDAGHRYQDVAADIAAWLPKLKHAPHAIICGHDYGDVVYPGVEVAVKERFGDAVQVLGHVWYVKPYAVDPHQQTVPVAEPLGATIEDEYEEVGYGYPPVSASVPVSKLADVDAEHLKEFLDVWNKGGNPKRILYCGVPDGSALELLVRASRGGGVFCAVKRDWMADGTDVIRSAKLGVKFIPCDDLATADFWDTDKADLVFIHESVLSQDLLNNALVFVPEDGMILGTGTRPLEVEQMHVDRWRDGSLWAVFAGQKPPKDVVW